LAVAGSGFVAGRGAAVAFPFLLAAMVPAEQYGMFEVALAGAMLVCAVADFGVVGSLTYFAFKRKRPAYLTVARTHIVIVGAVLLACAAVTSHFSTVLAWTLVMAALLCTQSLWAMKSRIAGNAPRAYLFDGGLYLVGLAALAVAVVFRHEPSASIVVGCIAVAACAMAASHLFPFPFKQALRGKGRRFRILWSRSVKVAMIGVLSIGLALAPRLIAGSTLPADDLGAFAFGLRLAAIGLVAHGFLQTLWFRESLAGTQAQTEVFLSRLILLTVAAQVTVVLCAYLGTILLPGLFGKYRVWEHFDVLLVASCMTVLWANYAQQEGLCNKEGLAASLLVPLAVIAAAVVAVGLLAPFASGLVRSFPARMPVSLALLGCVAFFAAIQVQRSVLLNAGYELGKSRIVSVAAMALAALVWGGAHAFA
jgi:O-antigen/teichoic acid export membrane protein